MSSNENLTYLRNSLLAERARLTEAVQKSPHVQLFGRKRKDGSYQIYIRTNDDSASREIYVNNGLMPEAVQIAQGMFAKVKLAEVNSKIEVIDDFIKVFTRASAADVFLQKYPWILQLLDLPASNEERLQQWKASDYERNLAHPESLKFGTIVPGLIVRSKSEADIVSRLETFGIPYHYDEMTDFSNTRLAMDFVCLNVNTGKIWYWDHRGMLDNPSYVERALYRERQFLNAGIIPGINLIQTNETSAHPLSILEIDEMIRHYLL